MKDEKKEDKYFIRTIATKKKLWKYKIKNNLKFLFNNYNKYKVIIIIVDYVSKQIKQHYKKRYI